MVIKMVELFMLSRKWSREILEELESGPRGFNELLSALSSSGRNISTRSLSDRLKDFEEEGLVQRRLLDQRPPRTIYTLTPKGRLALSYVKKIEKL